MNGVIIHLRGGERTVDEHFNGCLVQLSFVEIMACPF